MALKWSAVRLRCKLNLTLVVTPSFSSPVNYKSVLGNHVLGNGHYLTVKGGFKADDEIFQILSCSKCIYAFL